MRGYGDTYFQPDLCLNTHFIITGYTNDIFCNDQMQLTDIKQELHRHLRAHGFDAVVFLDVSNVLYCYDEPSYFALCNNRLPEEAPQPAPVAPPPAEDDPFAAIAAEGPMGGRRRRRGGPAHVAPAPAPVETGSLNRGRMYLNDAWAQVIALLRNPDIRSALVLSNANAMQNTLNDQTLQALQELSGSRSGKHSIAVYIFRENSLSDLVHNAAQGSGPWWTLLNSTLRPRIETGDPENNCVITLGSPNAAEVRNLLNHLRLRRKDRLAVESGAVNTLALFLAQSCARQHWSLDRLRLRLERWGAEHPGEALRASDWNQVTGEEAYRPALEELHAMVGLTELKERMDERYAEFRRRFSGGPSIPAHSSRFTPPLRAVQLRDHELNMVLKGPPGTGKSTVARLTGRLYYELGLLPQGHFTEVSGGAIVSHNVGETARQMRELVQGAMGGVLFIDEAYSLATNRFGREAINQLVADLSTYEGQFAVILAGYPQEMDRLMEENDGLSSRFPNVYDLPAYTPEEIRTILEARAASDPEGVSFAPELAGRLDDFCRSWVNSGSHRRGWGNAREAGLLLSRMKKRCTARLLREGTLGEAEGLVLTAEDVPEELQLHLHPRSHNLAEAYRRIEDMIGLHAVKRFLRDLGDGILWDAESRAPGNFIFFGPPGTGKTVTARHMGELLHLLGVLTRWDVIECPAGDLLSLEEGDTDVLAPLRRWVEEARGGILFIDEAHQLCDSDQGRAVLRGLVPIIEDPEIRSDTAFILAGYTVEMKRLLRVDPGLSRRFPENHRIRFEDYTARELTAILEEMCRARGEEPTRDYLDRTTIALERYLEHRPDNFGNGGFMRDTYLPDSIRARTARLNRCYARGEDGQITAEEAAAVPAEEKHTLTGEDLPPAFARLAGPVGRPLPPHRDAMTRLAELIGKEDVKEYVRAYTAREAEGFADEGNAAGLHFALSGPTGSGRRTTVRTLAAVWHHLGLLERDEVVFAGKADLEAGYVGQTAPKTRDVVERAVGGTLAVLSPSALLPSGPNDNTFGPEALGVIAGAMGEYAGNLSVVLVDTPEGLEEVLRRFPALGSQLSHTFVLDDLTPGEMEDLFRLQAKEGMFFPPELDDVLPEFFLNWVSDRGGLGESARSWGNGLEVERLLEALRLGWRQQEGDRTEEDGLVKRVITPACFPAHLRRYLTRQRVVANEAMDKLKDLPGLDRVKEAVNNIRRKIRYLGGEQVTPGLYCFIGNPGVGKTKVAGLMGGVLKAAGVLDQGHVIVRTARQLADDPRALDDALKLAKNGVLFIDEAHQLASDWGPHVIKRLLTALEDVEVIRHTAIILAGYPNEMGRLLQMDSGLASRFGTSDSLLYFDDYEPEELQAILDHMAQKAPEYPQIGSPVPLVLEEEYRQRALEVFVRVRRQRDPNFGNARFVRNFLHDSLDQALRRVEEDFGPLDDPPRDTLYTLTGADLPPRWARQLTAERAPAVVSRSDLSTMYAGPLTAETYERVSHFLSLGVLLLEILDQGRHVGYGSGCIITREGHVLTCAHVAEGGDTIRARICIPGMTGGDTRWFSCRKLDPVYQDCDMALLKLEGTNFPIVTLRPAGDGAREGEGTLMLGYPLGALVNGGDADTVRISQFTGRVASIQRMSNGVERYYVDSMGLHGNSGSPVFSLQDGRVIGVFSGSIKPQDEEINFFYPIEYFWERFLLPEEEEERHG